MALSPQAVDNTDDDFAVIGPEAKPVNAAVSQKASLQDEDDFAVVDVDSDFDVVEPNQSQPQQPIS